MSYHYLTPGYYQITVVLISGRKMYVGWSGEGKEMVTEIWSF